MEFLITTLAAIAILSTFDSAVLKWGVDSRDRLGDAHRR
jgi:hypothetical protein